MAGPAGMLARVAILRVVAATNVAARAAQAQVHPGVSHGQAFHASVAGRRDRSYAVQMTARWMTLTHCSPASLVKPRVLNRCPA
jgi:hypothetical protein